MELLLGMALVLGELPVVSVEDLITFPSPETVERERTRGDRFRACLLIDRERERVDVAFWDDWLDDYWRAEESWRFLADMQEFRTEHNLRRLRDNLGANNYVLRRMPDVTPYAPRLWAPWLR